MKKLIATSLFLFSLLAPAYASADATYTCSGGSGTLAPITVADPLNANASQVSAYISNCSSAGGTASGPSAQQLQTSANDRVSQGFSDIGTANTAQQTAQPAGAQTQSTGQTQAVTPFCKGGVCTYTPLEPIPCPAGAPGCKNGAIDVAAFPNLVGNIFRLLIGAGGLIAIVMLVLGALTYMFSDIAGNKKDALERIRGAMWAIVLLVSSYLILYTINPDLISFKLAINPTNNFDVGPQQSTPVRVPVVNPSGTKIYDGPDSYDQQMNLAAQCESGGAKALHQVGRDTDSKGGYMLYKCE